MELIDFLLVPTVSAAKIALSEAFRAVALSLWRIVYNHPAIRSRRDTGLKFLCASEINVHPLLEGSRRSCWG